MSKAATHITTTQALRVHRLSGHAPWRRAVCTHRNLNSHRPPLTYTHGNRHTSSLQWLHRDTLSHSHLVGVRSLHVSPVCAASAAASSSSSVNSSGLIEFVLADIGEGIYECEIVRWHVKPGDTVHQFDKVCEVQSDKANVEITSRFDGVVVELKYQVGQLAQVGTALMLLKPLTEDSSSTQIGEKDFSQPAVGAKDYTLPVTPSQQQHGTSSEQSLTNAGYPLSSVPADQLSSITPEEEGSLSATLSNDFDSSTSSSSRVLTSPAVRRIAREERVDLHAVKGSGPGGRILKDDVLQHAKNRTAVGKPQEKYKPPITTATQRIAQASTQPAHPTTHAATSSYTPATTTNTSTTPAAPLQSDVTVPISGLQRIMVAKMTEANSVPHFTFSDEINMGALAQLREQLKHTLSKDRGIKLSYLPFLIKSLSLALHSYPQLNAHTNADCTALIYRADHNVGLAMDSPKGLLVPNIKRVQTLSIIQIAQELTRLQAAAQQAKMSREDLTGGTITLSNIGSIGGSYMSPVLVVPEVAIAALGAIRVLPRFDAAGVVRAEKIMNVSWSGDHRVVDGATIARFNTLWKSFIEQPTHMLIDLK